jgi:predicted NAD/FAD-binding protein
MTNNARKNIAIIGTGISGLGAAYLLHPHHAITVYEKGGYVGGHSRTMEVSTDDGVVPVDTGFIVFNYRNYPLLTGLFSHLQVPVSKSDMSFGVSIRNGWMEYGTQQLQYMFAQKRNLLRPAFWRMLSDIMRFNAKAKTYLESDPTLTLGECLDELGMGQWFRDYYLLAMGGAIWSTPLAQMLNFPAATLIRFFDNHGLLTVNDQPTWHTVAGGSREYVQRLSAGFADRIRLNCGVSKVVREQDGVRVIDVQGREQQYDEVVFACHADQALSMIVAPHTDEQRLLSAFSYQPNRVVLHRDSSFMPKRKKAWSSWVYLSEEYADQSPHVSLTYWMNNLQPLATRQPIFVMLNPSREPDSALVYDDHWFEHPVFDEAAIRAQAAFPAIQGKDRLWFCGAYQRYGFHEDGLASAVSMAQLMGITPPWK